MIKNNRKVVTLATSILLLLIFGTSLLPIAKADTEQYEQRTDRLNPFLFSVDTIYTMSSYDYHMKNDSFHQIVLDEDNFYVFYIKSSLVRYNMTVWIQISDGSQSYFREDCGDGEYELLMVFRPQKTGLFEIIISNRNYHTPDDLRFKIDEIGILEVPEYSFNYNLDYDRYETEIEEKWDSQYVVFGIVYLDRFVDYRVISGYKIYKGYLGQYSLLGSVKLNGDNSFEEQYTSGDIINVSSEAYYLFYEILGNPFRIYYQDSIDSIDSIEPKIPSFNPLIIIGIIGSISAISAIIIRKRINKLKI